MSDHELLDSSAPLTETTSQSTDGSRGRRVDDERAGTRPGDPDMRLARLPTEPIHREPSAREVLQALRRDECETAVAKDRERIAAGLYDTVIHRLFAAGLQLQATCQVVEGPARLRIEDTIDLLDTTISELRKAIFSLR